MRASRFVVACAVLSLSLSETRHPLRDKYRCDLERLDGRTVTSEQLAKRTKPVILEGLTQNWTAFEKWTAAGFKKHYGEKEVALLASQYATVTDLKIKKVALRRHNCCPASLLSARLYRSRS